MNTKLLQKCDAIYDAPALAEYFVRVEAGFVLSDSTSLEEIPELPSDGIF
jgi:hypothetical protein